MNIEMKPIIYKGYKIFNVRHHKRGYTCDIQNLADIEDTFGMSYLPTMEKMIRENKKLIDQVIKEYEEYNIKMKPVINNEEDYEMVLVEVVSFAITQGITFEDFIQDMMDRWNEYSIAIKEDEHRRLS